MVTTLIDQKNDLLCCASSASKKHIDFQNAVYSLVQQCVKFCFRLLFLA